MSIHKNIIAAENTPKKVFFETFGCKVNYAETSRLVEEFSKHKTIQCDKLEDADILVLNTCSVTQKADADARKAIRHALRINPKIFVIVTGCSAEVNPEQFRSIEGVDIITGNSGKFELLSIAENFDKLSESVVLEPETSDMNFEYAYSSESDSRSRAVLKIQDGCEYNCTYCIIPQARGYFRSMPFEDIIPALREIESKGFREAVLVGINLSEYRHGESRFRDVLQQIADSGPDVRVRISSIEPNILDKEIIDIVKNSEKICHHFHIPLQSGSDKILAQMRRRYTRGQFIEKVRMINQEIPDAAIGIDIITGFPGETEEDFLQTIELLQEIKYSYLHAFSYSERANTPAARMNNKIDGKVKKERTGTLRELSEIAARKFYENQIGTEVEVIFEKEISKGRYTGHSGNYLQVEAESSENIIKSKMNVRLIKFINGKMSGKILLS